MKMSLEGGQSRFGSELDGTLALEFLSAELELSRGEPDTHTFISADGKAKHHGYEGAELEGIPECERETAPRKQRDRDCSVCQKKQRCSYQAAKSADGNERNQQCGPFNCT